MALENVDLMSKNINPLLFFYVGQSAPSPWLSWSLTHFVGVDVRVSYHLRFKSRPFRFSLLRTYKYGLVVLPVWFLLV